MHEPDKDPDTSIISDKRWTVQWMANISLFGGVGLSVLGALLSVVSGRAVFYAVAVATIVFAALTMKLAKDIPDERARGTAALAIVLNVLLFIIALMLFIFFKEASRAF